MVKGQKRKKKAKKKRKESRDEIIFEKFIYERFCVFKSKLDFEHIFEGRWWARKPINDAVGTDTTYMYNATEKEKKKKNT